MAKRTPKFSINLDTIAVDVRDACLGAIRSTGKNWSAMSEHEQRLTSERLYNLGVEVATKAAVAVAGAGYAALHVGLGAFGVTDKGSIKGNFTIGEPDETSLGLLMDMRGKQVVILKADASEYTNARRDVAIDLDQKELALDDAVDLGDGEEGGDGDAIEVDPSELIGKTIRTAGGNVGVVVLVHAVEPGEVHRVDIDAGLDGGGNPIIFKKAAVDHILTDEEVAARNELDAMMPAPEAKAKKPRGGKKDAASPAAQAAADAGIGA